MYKYNKTSFIRLRYVLEESLDFHISLLPLTTKNSEPQTIPPTAAAYSVPTVAPPRAKQTQQ